MICLTPVPPPTTVKRVRDVSVPHAMNRNFVTGAVPVPSFLVRKSIVMLMRELIIIKLQKLEAGIQLLSRSYIPAFIIILNHFLLFQKHTHSAFYLSNRPSQPSPSVFHPTADLLSLSNKLHIYHICRKGALHSPVTGDL